VRPDALGRTPKYVDEEHQPGPWRWHLDTATLEGLVPPPSDGHLAGLRVAVVADAGLPGDADTHEVVEDVAVALPVGRARWAGRPYASPATSDEIWLGSDVRVAWVVAVERRGPCAVLIEAAPQLTHPSGCVAVLTDLKVRRVLGPGEALVIGVDPGDPASEQAAALVGATPGRPARFVIRIRG
jgi:hypothetical protein